MYTKQDEGQVQSLTALLKLKRPAADTLRTPFSVTGHVRKLDTETIKTRAEGFLSAAVAGAKANLVLLLTQNGRTSTEAVLEAADLVAEWLDKQRGTSKKLAWGSGDDLRKRK